MGNELKSLSDSQFAKELKKSAHQIWLAGLGAFSRAEEEGGKVFDALVKAGEEIEVRTKSEVKSVVEERVKAAGTKVDEVKTMANDTWDKLERVFDDRVSRALGRLGVPTKDDIESLTGRIEALNKTIKELEKKPATRTRKTAASSTASKTSA